jgi:hypothetical protein
MERGTGDIATAGTGTGITKEFRNNLATIALILRCRRMLRCFIEVQSSGVLTSEPKPTNQIVKSVVELTEFLTSKQNFYLITIFSSTGTCTLQTNQIVKSVFEGCRVPEFGLPNRISILLPNFLLPYRQINF